MVREDTEAVRVVQEDAAADQVVRGCMEAQECTAADRVVRECTEEGILPLRRIITDRIDVDGAAADV